MPLPSLSDQKVTSPPLVVMLLPLANEILPCPFNITALAVAAVDVLRFWLTVMAPP